ncbi:TPA: hypothetical protein ACRL4Y_005513 [Pseudomonas aeruginosa]|uniref:zinc ribbon domain-containing protein n=1 Tax=Pseudomonas aeruginosa TaxID=287 RepID=UPI0020B79DA4|nr:zinc ribbon domain-containing protein [Pseudomonas aeruginosa]
MSKELNKALDLLREIRPSIPKDVLELWCKDRDAFLAQRSEFHQHLKECADEVATWPTYKQEALGPFLGHELGIEGETETANELNKAPVEQAGGDERDFQAKGAQEVPSPVSKEYDRHLIGLLRKGEALPGHQEEAADEIERLHDWNDHLNNTVLPNILNPNFLMLMKGGERLLDLCTKDGKFIGVSLNDMKDVFDWMVTHARIAPDHAALPQPSPASDLDPFNLAPHAEAFNEAPAEALKSDQAEVERPDVVAVVRAQGFGRVCEADANALYQHCSDGETLMTVAQHERIVGELRAVIAQLRQHKNDYMDAGQETYRALQNEIREREAEIARLDGLVSGRTAERDAALARVAELERGKVYVEARQCDECQHGGINDSATGVAACHECDWTGPEPEEDRCPGCQRENCMAAACPQCGARYVLVASEEIAAPVAQAQHSVPEISGIGRDAEHPRAVVLYLRNEPSEEDMRAIQNFLRAISADVLTQAQHSMPKAWLDVQAERRRQITAEGWTPEHDDEHNGGELADAAACYALWAGGINPGNWREFWPWAPEWLKHSEPRRMLVKAAALILAEIQRLDRAAAAGKEVGHE